MLSPKRPESVKWLLIPETELMKVFFFMRFTALELRPKPGWPTASVFPINEFMTLKAATSVSCFQGTD